jgi:hypothetical protein
MRDINILKLTDFTGTSLHRIVKYRFLQLAVQDFTDFTGVVYGQLKKEISVKYCSLQVSLKDLGEFLQTNKKQVKIISSSTF